MPFAMQRYVFVTDGREEALKAADGARYVRRIAMAMRNKYGELEGAFLKETPAADEPELDEIAERLPDRRPRYGCGAAGARDRGPGAKSHQPVHGDPGTRQAQILTSIERFGAEVMPRLERRFGDLRRSATVPRHRPLFEWRSDDRSSARMITQATVRAGPRRNHAGWLGN